MTEPTITDEELAAWWDAPWRHPRDVRHLIFSLRSTRQAPETNAAKADELAQEVERLRAYIAADPMRACYEEAEAERVAFYQRLATVRALHPRGPDGLCPRCRVDWPCETAETAEAVGE